MDVTTRKFTFYLIETKGFFVLSFVWSGLFLRSRIFFYGKKLSAVVGSKWAIFVFLQSGSPPFCIFALRV
jgi:hypothetical protein